VSTSKDDRRTTTSTTATLCQRLEEFVAFKRASLLLRRDNEDDEPPAVAANWDDRAAKIFKFASTVCLSVWQPGTAGPDCGREERRDADGAVAGERDVVLDVDNALSTQLPCPVEC
jgi:hypothetical protein